MNRPENRNGERALGNDKWARVPFAVLAVLILLLSSVSIAYLAMVNKEQVNVSSTSSLKFSDVIAIQQAKLKDLAQQSVMNVITSSSNYESVMWKIQSDVEYEYKNLLSKYYSTGNEFLTGRYRVGIGSTPGAVDTSKVNIRVAPLPFEYVGTNILGQSALLRSPVYYQISGSVPIVIKDTVLNKIATDTIDLDRVVPTTRAFLMDQASRLFYDAGPHGLVNDIVEYVLERDAQLTGSPPTKPKIQSAISFAMDLEMALLYRYTTNSIINSYAGKSSVDVYQIWSGKSGTNRVMVDLSYLNTPFKFDGSKVNMANTERSYKATYTLSMSPDSIYLSPERTYAQVSSESWLGAKIWDYSTTTVTVKISTEETDVPQKDVVRFDRTIPVTISGRVGIYQTNGYSPTQYPGTEQLWGSIDNYGGSFYTDYGRIMKIRADINLDPENKDGVPFSKMSKDIYADFYLDQMFIGSYQPNGQPLTLKNIKEGQHGVQVTFRYPDGTMENGYGLFNVTSPKTIDVNFNTSAGISTSTFWTISMAYLQANKVEKKDRMWKLSEFYGSLVGYPFPVELKQKFATLDRNNLQQVNDTLLGYIKWADGFKEYLRSKKNSIAFSYNFESYSIQEAIFASIAAYAEIAISIVDTISQGKPVDWDKIDFIFENLPNFGPVFKSYDDIIALLIELGDISDILSGLFPGVGSIPDLYSDWEKFVQWYNNCQNDTKCKTDFATYIPLGVTALVTIWKGFARGYTLQEYVDALKNNYNTWYPRIKYAHDTFSKLGLSTGQEFAAYGAIVLGKLIFGEGKNWTDYFDDVMGKLNFWVPKITQLRSNLKSLGLDNMWGYAAVLLGKYVISDFKTCSSLSQGCKALNWSEYIDKLNTDYLPTIISIKDQVSKVSKITGINDIYIYAAIVAGKFMFARTSPWLDYLADIDKFWLPQINQTATYFKNWGINSIYGFAGVIIGKFIFEPRSSWRDYMNNVTSIWLPSIDNLINTFKNLGINGPLGNAVGFGAVVLIKYTLARDMSWQDYMADLDKFWLPHINTMLKYFDAWGLRSKFGTFEGSLIGFAAVVAGKFILEPKSSWRDYFDNVTNSYMPNIDSLHSSFGKLGISDLHGFAAVIIGKFIVGKELSWKEYLEKASNFVANITEIKTGLAQLDPFGFNLDNIYSYAAIALGKFIFGVNKTWDEYITDVKNFVNAWVPVYNNLKAILNDYFQQLTGINSTLAAGIALVAIAAGKFIFAEGKSWDEYLKNVNKYLDKIKDWPKYYKMFMDIKDKIGWTGILIGAAAALGALVALKFMVKDYKNMPWKDYIKSVIANVSFWAGRIGNLINIFNKYKDQPFIYRLVLTGKDVMKWLDDLAVYFINDMSGTWSILGKDTWKKIHNFIQTFLSGITDIITIVQTGISLYTSWVKLIQNWKSYFEDWTQIDQLIANLYDTVNVLIKTIDFTIMVLKFINTHIAEIISKGLIDSLQKIQTFLSTQVLAVIGAIAAIANVVKMFLDVLKANNGDLIKTIKDLFFSISLTAALWYFTLATAVFAINSALLAFGISISWLPVVGQILLVIAIVIFILWAIFNWDDFMAMLFGGKNKAVDGDTLRKVEQDLSETLNKTMYLVAGINDANPMGSSIRTSYEYAATSYVFEKLELFIADKQTSEQLDKISQWYGEYSLTLKDYIRTMLSLKYAIMSFWKQTDDLVSDGRHSGNYYGFYGMGKWSEGFAGYYKSCGIFKCKKYYNTYAGWIIINGPYTPTTSAPSTYSTGKTTMYRPANALIQDAKYQGDSAYMENFFKALTMSIAENTSVRYQIITYKDGVFADGFKVWGDTMNKVGEELSYWYDLYSKYRSRIDYIQNYFDVSQFKKIWGMIVIYIDERVQKVDITITKKGGGSFTAKYNATFPSCISTTTCAFTVDNTIAKGLFSLYVDPTGDYTVSWGNAIINPPYALKIPTTKVVKVPDYNNLLSLTSENFTVKIDVKDTSLAFNYKFYIFDEPNPNWGKKCWRWWPPSYSVANCGYKYNVSIYIDLRDKNGNIITVFKDYDSIRDGFQNSSYRPTEYIDLSDALDLGTYIHIEVKIDIDNNGANGYEVTQANVNGMMREFNIYSYIGFWQPEPKATFELRIYWKEQNPPQPGQDDWWVSWKKL